MLKLSKLDYWIISIIFLILPIDMLNGILLNHNIYIPISISQAYKIFIIGLFSIRITINYNKLFFILLLFFILILPSIYQVIKENSIDNIFADSIKITRYLLSIFSFMFFTDVFRRNRLSAKKLTFKLVKFSYTVLVVNIFSKYIGLGYPMYLHGNIGSRGFFHAGNELSALLIILSSIIAFNLWIQNKKPKYYLFLILNIAAGISLSSKTGILGVLLIFFLIPTKYPSLNINLKKLKSTIISIIIILPIVLVISWNIIKNSPLFLRFTFFWEKLDLLTFILSNRNTFADKAFNVYMIQYNFIEKIIGVGQSKFEQLNKNKIIEIDFLDIFFAYGLIGLIIFIMIISYIIIRCLKFKRKNDKYPYANFVFLMIIITLSISTVAGHVFNSGLTGIFLGILFSLMYLKINDKKRRVTIL